LKKGDRYVNDNQLHKIVYNFFAQLRRASAIFLTTNLRYPSSEFGLNFLSFPKGNGKRRSTLHFRNFNFPDCCRAGDNLFYPAKEGAESAGSRRKYFVIHDLISARESERMKIARDLHDELGPSLTGLKLLLGSLSVPQSPESLSHKFNLFSSRLDSAIQYVRTISQNLQGEFNFRNGFSESILEYISLVNGNSTMTIEPWFDFEESIVNESVLENLYRIIAELITNSIRHSNGDTIKIAIRKYEKMLFVVYIDNGTAWLRNRLNLQGTGLENITERVSSMNGELNIDRQYARCFITTIKIKNEIILNDMRNNIPVPTQISVLIADDHPFFRSGLKYALSTIPYISKVSEADSGDRVLSMMHHDPADIILMDVRMPGMDGVQTTLECRKLFPGVKILGLSMSEDENQILEMMDNGASGYLLKVADKTK